MNQNETIKRFESNSEKVENTKNFRKYSDPTDSSLCNKSTVASRNRSKSTLILSSLPSLFNNLRTIPADNRSSESTRESVSVFKRLFGSRNSSQDKLDKESDQKTDNRRKDLFLSGNSLSMINSNELRYFNDEIEFGINRSQPGSISIPSIFLEEGLTLLKVSRKSKKRIYFQIDPKTLTFTWKVANKNQSTGSSSNTDNKHILSNTNDVHVSSPNGFHRILQATQTQTIGKNKFYKFSVDDVKDILLQLEARHYRDEMNISKELEKQWITIHYYYSEKNKMKTLHLIADTEYDLKRFYSTISNLKKLKVELSEKFYIDLDDMDDEQRKLILSISSTTNQKQPKEHLSFDDVVKYMQRLNININRNYLKTIFDSLSESAQGETAVLNFEKFKEFVAILKRRTDIDQIWSEICNCFGSDTFMNFKTFAKFIEQMQKEDLSLDMLEKIFDKFCKNDQGWDSDSLNQFLLSKYSKPTMDGMHEESYYSMPLNEYFISSSHNTYLTGRQIVDESSTEGYTKALQKGCRCVEIDIWDGEDELTNDVIPIVCHGKLFTSEISLRNVLTTIKRYAFVASPFPLILSLEINCSLSTQYQVVSLLLDILGEYLITEPLKGVTLLPSPNDLKHKILIKAKRTGPLDKLYMSDNGALKGLASNGLTSTSTSTSNTSFSEDNSTITTFNERKKKRNKKVIDELSDLAVYIQGIRFRNFSLPESKTYNHCFSLNEKVIDSMLKDQEKRNAVDKHNRRYFMRVYPSNMRLKSSNFHPIEYWLHGIQMVATNWQTYDLGQQINEALFDGIDKLGYVLKPKDIRKPLLKHTMRNVLDFTERKFHFNLKIIGAHQLPKPYNVNVNTINPFVCLEIIGAHDVKLDKESCIVNTSTITDNGFNPIWNQLFSGLVATKGLLFLKLSLNTSVSKDSSTVLGVFMCKIDNLKKGYRYLPLNDAMGEELIYSSLFVHIAYSEI